MKLGRFVVNVLKWNSYRSTLKRRKLYPIYTGKYDERIDIPYIDDGDHHHKFDVLLAKENRKNCVIIDIHGGSYIFGEHMDQYAFGDYFLKEGYDFISADYIPSDGKNRGFKEIFDDLYAFLKYVFSHQKELGIEGEDVVITGDSAGGHMALTLSELLCDKEYAKEVGYDMPNVKLVACLPNCPVYDFVNMSEGQLARSGQKRILGPKYNDKFLLALYCPRTHIDSLKCPTFVSTCKRDFLREHSLLLYKELQARGVESQIVDLDTDDKTTGHVHNVLHPFRPFAVIVNDAMIEFIEKARKK